MEGTYQMQLEGFVVKGQEDNPLKLDASELVPTETKPTMPV